MTKLTTVEMQQCISNTRPMNVMGYHQTNLFQPDAHCTCKGFCSNRSCSHMAQAEKEACLWHQLDASLGQTPYERRQMICPRCGLETVWVTVEERVYEGG